MIWTLKPFASSIFCGDVGKSRAVGQWRVTAFDTPTSAGILFYHSPGSDLLMPSLNKHLAS